MAGANPEVRGHPGASGKPDIRRGNPVCVARDTAPTCRRCGEQRWAGDAPPQARCAMSLSPQRRRRTTGGRRPPQDLPGLRGRHRQQPGAEPTAAARRRAEAGKRSRRFRARPEIPATAKGHAPNTLAAAAGNGKPQPPHWTAAESASKGEPRHRRGSDDLRKALDGPSKLSHPTPVPAAMRPRRGRSVYRGFSPCPSTAPRSAARLRGRRLATAPTARARHAGREPWATGQLLPHVERERVRRCGRQRRFRRRTLPSPPSARTACRTGRCTGRLLRRGRR